MTAPTGYVKTCTVCNENRLHVKVIGGIELGMCPNCDTRRCHPCGHQVQDKFTRTCPNCGRRVD